MVLSYSIPGKSSLKRVVFSPSALTSTATFPERLVWIFLILLTFTLAQIFFRSPNSSRCAPGTVTPATPAFIQSRHNFLSNTVSLIAQESSQQQRQRYDNERASLLNTQEDHSINGEADLAYFIQVSESSIQHLPRLLSRIYHPRNVYALHFDAKIPRHKVHNIISLLNTTRHLDNNPTGYGTYDNVYFMPRETVTYRGISMVLNVLNGMEFLIMQSNGKRPWDFWINISGSDYPLLSPRDQRRLLGLGFVGQSKRNFVGLMPKPLWEKHKKWRFGKFYVDNSLTLRRGVARETGILNTHVKQPLAEDFGSFEFVSAGAWMVLHRSAVEELLLSSLARQMLSLFSYAVEPEEHYFGVFFYNHPQLNKTLIHHSLRQVVWFRNGIGSGQHPYYIDEIGEDGSFPFFDSIRGSAGLLFSRKFKEPNSPVMAKIDREVSGLAPHPDKAKVDLFRYNAKRRWACMAARQTALEKCLHQAYVSRLPDNVSPDDFP